MLLIFIIVAFNIFIAASSYFLSSKVNTYNAFISNLAKQQVMLDKMSKYIIDINLFSERFSVKNQADQDSDAESFLEDTYRQQKSIAKDYHLLDNNIALFANGGELSTDSGSFILPAPSGEAITINTRIQEIWQPLSGLISSTLKQFKDNDLAELEENIKFAADYVRKYSEILDNYFEELKSYYQEQANQYSFILKILQLMAICFTILFFALLTFWGLRSLIRSDRKIEHAQKETANIMKTVKEGLFLIDEQLHIGQQYSAQLETILGQQFIAGQELKELLSKIIRKQDYETTHDFIEQLFNPDVIESLIHELNPLDRIKVYISPDHSNSMPDQRYLSFSFSRVYDDDGNIINVLASVADITRQVALEERIEKERVQHDEQLELLSDILNIPSANLTGFIRNVQTACQNINDTLRGSNLDRGNLMEKANKIFREAHGIKGEASALGLQHFVSVAENLEGQIATLRNKSNLSGRDFLPLTIELDRTLLLVQKITDLQMRITTGRDETSASVPTTGKQDDAWQFSRLITEVAKRQGKQVEFSLKNWEATEILSQTQQDKLREIITQLLRNAVVHGIEPDKVRLAAGKSAAGHIYCEAVRHTEDLIVTVYDDGSGIDFTALQAKAVAEGKIDLNQPAKEIRQSLTRYLFSSGVSTRDQHDEDGGRGVGMDVVKNRVQALGAHIALASKEGISTTFQIRIPLDSE